jgi:hypothetical protein
LKGSTQLDDYSRTRRALLDAVEALADYCSAFVVIGAHAIYLSTEGYDCGVQPHTRDVDLAVNPGKLRGKAPLGEAIRRAGFKADIWCSGRWWFRGTAVDLLVPLRLEQQGNIWAQLGEHGDRTARSCSGLRATLVDNAQVHVAALDPTDPRSPLLTVAGPTHA